LTLGKGGKRTRKIETCDPYKVGGKIKVFKKKRLNNRSVGCRKEGERGVGLVEMFRGFYWKWPHCQGKRE